MQCDHAQELFSDYVTGEIDHALTVSVENHLTGCQVCRETVEDLRQAWAMLDKMPVVEPPPLFHATLMSRLAEEQAQSESPAILPAGGWDWRALFRPRALAFAATIFILLMAGTEVVQTQRAALGPMGWILNMFRPAPPVLQTARAEWTPDPTTGHGVLTVHLKATPMSIAEPTRFSYRLVLETERPLDFPWGREGEVSSEKETTVTLRSASPPLNSPSALRISLTPAEEPENSASQPMNIKIDMKSASPAAP